MIELFEPDLLVENGIGADPVFLIGAREIEMDPGFEGDSADQDDPCFGGLPFDFPAENESAVGIFEHDFRDRKIEATVFQKFFRFGKSGNSGRAESDSFQMIRQKNGKNGIRIDQKSGFSAETHIFLMRHIFPLSDIDIAFEERGMQK